MRTPAHPASNYLLADDVSRPRFGPAPGKRFETDSRPIVLVIGAGFTGLSAALRLGELRQSSGLQVRIVLAEAARVASGPSGKSAGHVCGLQPSDDAIRRLCGPDLANALVEAAATATRHVRELIQRYAIECDLRDGYVIIHSDGRQTVTEGGNEFGIDPYPFALGLARSAAELGVEILEGAKVTGLESASDGFIATSTAGIIPASLVLASGGHRMMEDIPSLAPLRRLTTELRVSTIITDPLPNDVLREVMPAAACRRFPFANESSYVAYGSIDHFRRVVFGAGATALGDPSPERIARALWTLLPSLLPSYRQSAGQNLKWRPLVVSEQLCFTRNLLPNVGAVAPNSRVLYVHALGGNGIAIGTLLGRAAAEKLWGIQVREPAMWELFDRFASVPHGWLPPRQPWRCLAAAIGLPISRVTG